MKLGFVGLGKMGANMVERLLRGGHEVVAYNRSQDKVQEAVAKGAQGATSLSDLVSQLNGPKIIWLMVPSGAPVDENIAALKPDLQPGDILIDGGNSNWHDTQRRAAALASEGIHYVDCGTSGGIWGLQNGYCLMYGGPKAACEILEPIFVTLAPPDGHIYCGASGAGHFVKMVHNGIEYGMMQAYAEGFEIMQKAPFDINLEGVAHTWQQGSVVRSWLLELAERALKEDPNLDNLKGYVQDSGEGRWTVQAAIDLDVPAPVITQALFARFQSRQPDAFAMKLLAALRNQFGGHAVVREGTPS
jgi:6-phosphogluconate dehydrogenase